MTSAGRRTMLSAAAILGLAAPVSALAAVQDTPRATQGGDTFQLQSPRPAPVPTPVATPTPRAIPIPDAPRIVFPTPAVSPTPRAARPNPRATPTPQPSSGARTEPAPALEPTATPTPSPSPTPTSTLTNVPEAIAPAPASQPTPAAAASPVPVADDQGPALWPWIVGALVLAGLAVLVLRRRRATSGVVPEHHAAEEPAAPARKPAPVVSSDVAPVPAPVAAPVAPRAQLGLTLRPLRAGLNLLSATVECEVTITNAGPVAAQDVRLDVRLLSAGAGHDADLAAIYAEAPARPAVPAFTLEPGETRQVKALAALARAAITPMTAGGRPMFFPIVALVARYRANDAISGQTSQAFAVGIERVDSPKLAPLWLDQPARMHTGVAARPHAAVLES